MGTSTASSFELPDADALPGSKEAAAVAELKLDLAILKYARFARGGRFDPSSISKLFDQVPPVRDPKAVLAEIEAAPSPDLYLQSLHPKHEQFVRLRQALLKARAEGTIGGKPVSDRDIKKIVINMERWRWMPEDLGSALCVEQFAGVHALRGQGREADLCRQDPRRHARLRDAGVHRRHEDHRVQS